MASLMILRPAAIIVCGVLIASMPVRSWREYRVFVLLMAAPIALVALHLVPLPPPVWQALPGRDLIAQIDRSVGLGDIWRPLTISPHATWNALYALAVPLSVALYMIRLGPDRWRIVGPAVLALGLACMIMGLLQTTVVGIDSPLYPYRVSNFGAPIGLFANRNHTGTFIAAMLPWLAVFGSASIGAREGRDLRYPLRFWTMVIATPIALLFLLLLGSRAGLLLGLLGLASMPLLHVGASAHAGGANKSARTPIVAIGLTVAAAAAIVAVAVFASRAQSLERLLGMDDGGNYRVTTFLPILRLAGEYMPLGTGIGTFVAAWHRSEPIERLEPRYLNHAHDDVLELALTGGVPALLLIAAFVLLAVRAALPLFSRSSRGNRDTLLAKAAFATLCLFALASFVDYPLRTPALASLAVVMLAIVLSPKRDRPKRYGERPGAYAATGHGTD